MSYKEADFYQAMAARYSELSCFVPDEASDISLRFHALASQLAAMSARQEAASRQSFAATASGAALDAHASTRGLNRKGAVCAAGSLQFTRAQTNGNVSIPPGTVYAAADGAEYETTAAAEIVQGQQTVLVPARAVKAGKNGNAAAGMITLLRRPTVQIGAVVNPAVFTGGCDAESDDALRERVLSSYASQSNGANGAYYKQLAEGFDGVSSAKTVAGAGAGAGEIIVYVAANDQNVVQSAVKTALQTKLNTCREPCASIKVTDATAVAVDVAVAVEPTEDFSAAKLALEERIRQLLGGLAIGEKITLARLGQLVMDSGLANNYRFTAPVADTKPSAVQVLRAGVVAVSRMEG
ncbi:baseplate J/gp47 family protein [Oscillospiraceae bacterium PP1C4]